jgi:hypothetical protein
MNSRVQNAGIASTMPFTVNFYRTQNFYFDIRKNHYANLKAIAEKGDINARSWIEEFKELGTMLSIKAVEIGVGPE